MSEKYKFDDPDGLYFVTITVVKWVDVFTKPIYTDVILDSLIFCQKNKKLKIHAWVIMSNHLHMIVSRGGEQTLSDIIRDFKRFTSIGIIKEIKDSNDSRKEWMLQIFKERADELKRIMKYKFWQDGNHPILLDTNEMIEQRLDYLHNNPCKAGIVEESEHYINSSAIDYCEGKGLLEVDLIL